MASNSAIDTIASWYQTSLGREADSEGLQWWSSAAASGRDLDSLKSDFLAGAAANGEKIVQPAAPSAPSYSAPSSPSSGTGGGILSASDAGISGAPASWQFANYNGQGVRADQGYMDTLSRGAANMGVSALDYDKMLNPDTYGARWGASPTSSPSTYAAQASSGSSGGLPGGSPTGSSGGSGASADVGNWYRSVLGRDAEASGKAFWEEAVQMHGADKAYQDFLEGARRNNERVNAPANWWDANTYSGPQSLNATTPVDDWARNTLGRDLSASELDAWQAKFNAAASQGEAGAKAVYNEFLTTFGDQVKTPMDWVTASRISSQLRTPPVPTGPNLIPGEDLRNRVINPGTETVNGQMTGLLKEDSQYMQLARADAQRQAAERGMTNSTMAASAGTDAAIRSVLPIATSDAGIFGKASDYNTALENQRVMYNADTMNQFARDQLGYQNQQKLQQGQLAQQMTIAQMQNETERWRAEMSDATSRYNTDSQFRQQADNQKLSLANNILMTTDVSPDRKAALLEQLGFGTAAKRNADGTVTAGTGMAGAVYVIDDIAADLAPQQPGNAPPPGAVGMDGSGGTV